LSAATAPLAYEASAPAAGDDARRQRFYLSTVIFQRARQLKGGARPRIDARGHTTTRIALLEVLAGLVDSDGGSPASS
jgi:DNA-directed RNA polymerase subunit K/omega